MKQVIIIRKDLNMRKGKMIAQGSHASLSAYLDAFKYQSQWLLNGQKKIVVGVNSEAELFEIYKKANALEIPCSLIEDAGLTEFKEPTFTAVGLGPYDDEELNKITGDLKLL